ncbi:unnamed protein product [Cuscuta epithymum]|uniref:ATP-dependent DNA helicase n=1 Tax=Cuscuta epithymum TaxID=186058 RepID=A0AAV0BZR0_9ASTE|nr:unnamed protein product [Cuscuta epithymum]
MPISTSKLKSVDFYRKIPRDLTEASLSAEKLGLLQSNQDLEVCLQQALCWQMPSTFRKLFATILAFCDVANPRSLWTQFKEHLCEDLIKSSSNMTESEEKCLHLLNEALLCMGKNINEFALVSHHIGITKHQRIQREIQAERSLTPSDNDLLAIEKLNVAQKEAFDVIMSRVYSNKGGVFFVDGPGGTGKTFLYRCLLSKVRSNHDIALATATSGVAASLLPGGRTAHSRFKIPINIEDRFVCSIGKQSAEATLIRDSKLILWDEATMANRRTVENVDTTLRDITNSDNLFGDKVMVFGGDFRQTLPVIRSGGKKDCMDASLVNSHAIWPHIERLPLRENMRAKTDPGFASYLMRVGNGTEDYVSDFSIAIPEQFLIPYTEHEASVDALIENVFPDLVSFSINPYPLMQRGILTPKNDGVEELNDKLIQRMPGEERCYVSYDEALDTSTHAEYGDLLNAISLAGLPPHKLILKKNCPVMLLRNLNPAEGLCNGTRLICHDFRDHVINCSIATGEHMGKNVFIPKIPLQATEDAKCPIPFKRHQFPIKLCFAMTINKSQGQTFDYVGIYLREPVFSHGQLYVAMSRAQRADCLKILICNKDRSGSTNLTPNIVYEEILEKAHQQVNV